MYDILDKIEKILDKEEIISYKVQISTNEKDYLVVKAEQEQTNTNAIGFNIPSKNDYEE